MGQPPKGVGPSADNVADHLERRIRQQAAVADLGRIALASTPLADLFEAAVNRVAAALPNEFSNVLELLPNEKQLRLVAGVGWKPGLVSAAIVDSGLNSQAGYTLQSREPVIVADLRKETRFSGPAVLHEYGIVSGMSVLIGPPENPWGVLGTHSSQRVDYSEEDVHFIEAVANLLWEAIQRNRYEETIRRQLNEINAIYDKAPIGLCFLDRDLRYVRVNERLAAINGRSVADHLGKRPTDIVPDLAKQVQSLHQRVVETGEPIIDVEIHGITAADPGSQRDWLASYLPLWSDGGIAGINVVIREITQQKRTERALRKLNDSLEEQVRMRAGMIEVLHDIVCHIHEAAGLEEAAQFVLRRVAEFNGWSYGHAFLVSADSPDQLVPLRSYYEQPGGKFREFREGASESIILRGHGLPGRCLELGKPVWAERLPYDLRSETSDVIERLPIKSAAAFPVIVNNRTELVLEFFCTHSIEDDERIRQGMESVGAHLARTIERLRAEATLRESEQRFRELAESVDQVFWLFDPIAHELLYVSPAWSRIVGIPAKELVKDREQWRAFVHPEDQERIAEEFDAKAGRGDYNVVYRIVRADGTKRWMHDVAVPVHDETGKVRRIIGIAEDITERREMERQIADAATNEQQRLSHDLHDSIGQELTGLTMMASKLSQGLDSSDPLAEAAVKLVDGLKRTLQQVRRISRGLAPVNIEAGGLMVALAQLAEQTTLAGTTECVFHCEEPVILHDPGIATHLYRIAQEAVSNAVKHAQANHVIVTLASVDGFCQLVIEDDGRGMPPPLEGDGEGIGLRIMRYRANLIGARFRIESSEQAGTRVVCRVRQNGQQAEAVQVVSQ